MPLIQRLGGTDLEVVVIYDAVVEGVVASVVQGSVRIPVEGGRCHGLPPQLLDVKVVPFPELLEGQAAVILAILVARGTADYLEDPNIYFYRYL